MSDFFSAAAGAALPVSVVLLVLGVAARGVLWAQLDDPRWQRIARRYLEPLSTWSVAGFIVYALTLVAAGEAATAPLAIALVLAVAAAVLRLEQEDEPHVATAAAPGGRREPAMAGGNEPAAGARGAGATGGRGDDVPTRATDASAGGQLAPGRPGARAATRGGVATRDFTAAPASHLWDGDAEPAAPGALWARER